MVLRAPQRQRQAAPDREWDGEHEQRPPAAPQQQVQQAPGQRQDQRLLERPGGEEECCGGEQIGQWTQPLSLSVQRAHQHPQPEQGQHDARQVGADGEVPPRKRRAPQPQRHDRQHGCPQDPARRRPRQDAPRHAPVCHKARHCERTREQSAGNQDARVRLPQRR